METYDPMENIAVIKEGDYLAEVDTSLLGQFDFRLGSLFQFIGELQPSQAWLFRVVYIPSPMFVNYSIYCTFQGPSPVLRARVGRNVDLSLIHI